MKKALKILGLLLGLIVLVLVCGAAFIHFGGIPSYETEKVDLNIEYTPERVAQGEHLANLICANCHLSENRLLEGAPMSDVKEFGEIWSANITNHPTAGLGRYTDGELAYLLRTGIKRNGQYAPPYMPKFPHLSDEDLYSIIAYLRSDAPITKASDFQPPACKPSFLAKLLCRVAFKPFPYPEGKVTAPDTSDLVAYGKYVVTSKIECYACHSADFKKNDYYTPEQSFGYLGGGNILKDMEGKPAYSANLTMDKETGLGNWTREEFAHAVRTGQRPDGTVLSQTMPRLTSIADYEINAVWAYLNSLEPVRNESLKEVRAIVK